MFDGGDSNAHSINKLMRAPFTRYHKHGSDFVTKLFKCNRKENIVTLEEVTVPEQIEINPEWTV
jgi:hypothetical protein